MKTDIDSIKKHFAHIVGQEAAIERLVNAVASAKNGGPMQSPLLEAEAGGGKTALIKAYGEALREEAGADYFYFASPAEFRAKGGNYSDFVNTIMDSPKYAIAIDEAHLLEDAKTMQTRKIKAFIMKALDRNQQGGPIRFDDEICPHFSPEKGAFILGTNFPHKLDKSGAFQSRCHRIKLDSYSVPQLKKILRLMLKQRGLTTDDKNLDMIAKCGRGTARPMEKIVDELAIIASATGSNSFDRDQIVRALIVTKMYPRGITPEEIKIMTVCDGADKLTRVRISNMMPSVEKTVLNNSIGYLQNVPDLKEDGAETFKPFLMDSHGLVTTDLGRRYLRECAKAGFAVSDAYHVKDKDEPTEAKAAKIKAVAKK